jgi:hypothetical protein
VHRWEGHRCIPFLLELLDQLIPGNSYTNMGCGESVWELFITMSSRKVAVRGPILEIVKRVDSLELVLLQVVEGRALLEESLPFGGDFRNHRHFQLSVTAVTCALIFRLCLNY